MNQRLSEITEKITRSLQEVIREYEVTEEEWMQAIQFLTQVGIKDEFILLSDVLGISVLVNNLTHSHDHEDHATEYNVVGPLYRENAPLLKTPAKLCSIEESDQPLVMSGQIVSVDGKPIQNAIVDVWQANEKGDYENEDPNQKDYNLRGRIEVDEDGKYQFTSVVPGGYEIGKGGPVGELLKRIGRHAWRPGHIHFKIEAEGYKPLTTMLFIPNDPWIDSDAISAVKDSLILNLKKTDSPSDKEKYSLDKAFFICEYDFKLIANNQ
ncbi:catechol 1,2-dioxygenase [Neobacillus niacini]|uniref:dioxygenase family protein n=1 Tax=Neobacillus niacini TaxID=86668 RepID=UPI001045F894|nr:dioxygenase [Neobacillus niacini]MDR7075666.1 catechol 1,2-dioxygenase [Neobacillus niacini]